MGYTRYVYNRINWVNRSDGLTTPLGKTNMNRMDEAIYQIAENLDVTYNEMAAGKFDEANAGKVIMGMPTWNPETGILTFRFYDGTQFSVDFNIEKIPVSFSMDSAGVITMTTSDGTKWTADIGDAMPDAAYEDSGRIVFTRTKNADGSYTVTADLKKGSVTDEFMKPNYLADIMVQASTAQASVQSAAEYADHAEYDAKLAQSYAIGSSGIREGENTDSAKYYNEQAQQAAELARDFYEKMPVSTEIFSGTVPRDESLNVSINSGVYEIYYSFGNIYIYGLLLVGYNATILSSSNGPLSVSKAGEGPTEFYSSGVDCSVKITTLIR